MEGLVQVLHHVSGALFDFPRALRFGAILLRSTITVVRFRIMRRKDRQIGAMNSGAVNVVMFHGIPPGCGISSACE
jgi:hypothetical protein